jgi:isocitrate/isopropylmalate dehydrogenase
MLLEHSLEAPEAARAVREAVAAALAQGHRTVDLVAPGDETPFTGCRAMGDRVLEKLGGR